MNPSTQAQLAEAKPLHHLIQNKNTLILSDFDCLSSHVAQRADDGDHRCLQQLTRQILSRVIVLIVIYSYSKLCKFETNWVSQTGVSNRYSVNIQFCHHLSNVNIWD